MGRSDRDGLTRWALPLGIAVLAFVARFLDVRSSGGLHALLGYDEGVYFSGSTALVNGLVPYRDFVLVHPPGLLLLLSPFARIGSLTTDPTGWALARLFIMIIGGVNAALVVIVARRVTLTAAVVAGGLYALWSPAVHVERTTMLESFVLLGLLVALVALPRPAAHPTAAIVAGAFLGLGASVKLWGLVPLVVIVGWLVVNRAWRTFAIVAGTAAAVLALVVLPFAWLAPKRMWDMVVLGQLQRSDGGTARAARLVRMSNLDLPSITRSHALGAVVTVLLAVLLLSVIIVAWRGEPRSRLWVALLLVQGAVLMVVPVYFDGYSSFIAPALMLVTGTAAGVVLRRARAAPRANAVGARIIVWGLVVSACGLGIYRSDIRGEPNPTSPSAVTAAESAVRPAQCVASDSPGLLLLTDTLTRDIARGCPVLIDVDGTIYSIDEGRNSEHLNGVPRRLASPAYQQILTDYFAAADAVIIHRTGSDGLTPTSLSTLSRRTVLLTRRDLTVYGPTG